MDLETLELTRALQTRIRESLVHVAALPEQRDALTAALERPGHALSGDAGCRSGMLALGSYRASSGSLDDVALTAAAAVELKSEAAFLLDNVADGDVLAAAGPAQELALGLALSECASCVACEAARSAGSGIAALVAFHQSCVAACAGQLLDSRFEQRSDVTAQEALDMTCLKAGSLGRFAAGFGARLATRDERLVGHLEELGEIAFTFAQLVDDLRDACAPDTGQDDLRRAKKTVPLTFVRGGPADRVTIDLSRLGYESRGGWLFGALVAELLLMQARSIVGRLHRERCAVQGLGRFVDSLEHGFATVVDSLDARSERPARRAGRGSGPADDRGRARRPDPSVHAATG